MKIKQVLLTSTAALMLGTPVAPLFAQSGNGSFLVAQAGIPGPLVGAIQTYLDAEAAVQAATESGGDVGAAEARLESARAELTDLCGAIGQSDIEACIAMVRSGGMSSPAPQQPEVAPEPEPAAPEEPAPVEAAPEPQQPAPEPPAMEAPAPVVPEQPAAPEPEPEPAPVEAEQPAPQQPPAPPVQEPAPAPQPEQQAPAQPEQPVEPAAPLPAEPETPAAPTPGQMVPPALQSAVTAYQQAVADYEAAVAAGGDTQAAANAVIAAEGEFESICNALGQTDVAQCLAGFGIDIDLIDVDATAPAPGEATPAEPAPALDDDIMLDDNVQGEIVPEGTDASTVAPLLDSLKDAVTAGGADTQQAPAADAGQQPADAEPAQPPASDAEAQPQIDIEAIPSITSEQGQMRADSQFQPGERPAWGPRPAPGQQPQPQPQQPQQPQQPPQGGELVGPVPDRPSNVDIITTIGLATIFAIGANQFINMPDTPRIVYDDDRNYYVEDLPRGQTREVIVRADGSQIVTIRDRYGDVIRRSRIEPDGREILLVYVDPNARRYDDQGRWIDPGSQLPPLRLNIPARDYVLDASRADEQRVADFLDEPPVETLQRYYTIDEVKRSARLRDMVRRLEIGDLTFETASANISQSEVNSLSAVAYAMLDLIERNPAETFLIEGHTDAVGSDLSNLELSDRRAEAVAYALTRVYGIPAENIATQGYGERYLKVQTQAAERVNRRVTIRRITPLVTPMVGNVAG